MSDAQTIASHIRLAGECICDAEALLATGSRNAAYLTSQAAEHALRAVATSEELHIERRDAHQLDTIVRRLPDANIDKPALAGLAYLEAYATTYRYPTATGRIPVMPDLGRIRTSILELDRLLDALRGHHGVEQAGTAAASVTAPRR